MPSKIYKAKNNKNRWLNYQKAIERKKQYNQLIRIERENQKTKRERERYEEYHDFDK